MSAPRDAALRRLVLLHGLLACWLALVGTAMLIAVARGQSLSEWTRVAGALAVLLAPATVWAAHVARQVRNASARATEVANRLDTVVRTSHEWLWTTDAGGVITYASPVSEDYLGYTPEELTGRSLLSVLDPDEHEVMRQRFTSLARLGGDGHWTAIIRFRHRNGEERWLDSAAVPWLDDSGAVTAIAGTSRLLAAPLAEATASRRRRERVDAVLRHRLVRAAFQPIVDIPTRQIVGAEGLARFSVPFPPQTWFADAAEEGLGVDLELLAVETVLAEVPWLPPNIYVSVNASPATLVSPRLAETLENSDVPLDRLVIEVTEHVSIDDYPALNDALAPLRARGVRLAVDDAGAGFASFRHIVALGPDIIKLDRALVAEIDRDPARRALAAAVVVFALEMRAQVLAEGVETRAEMETVITLGMDAAQGHLLGRATTDRLEWATWVPEPSLRIAGDG